MNSALFLLLLAPAWADTDREDAVWSLSQCAAFHTIEADLTKDGVTAADAHRAAASDFANTAQRLAGTQPAKPKIEEIEKSYREQLSKGDTRTMAEGWTALELACKDLYGVREKLGEGTTGEATKR